MLPWYPWRLRLCYYLLVISVTSGHCRSLLTPERDTPGFDPSTCPAQEDWLPYHSKLREPYDVPVLDLPQLCEDHPKEAPSLLVVAAGKNKSTTAWLDRLKTVPHEVYHQDPLAHHNHDGSANEALVYLKFIAEHYDCLPKVTLFAHAHTEPSWHRRQHLDTVLKTLRWESFKGFSVIQRPAEEWTVKLQRTEQNLIGHEEKLPFPEDAGCPNVVNGTLYPLHEIQLYWRANMIAPLWDLYLGSAGLGPLPEQLIFVPGAEFVVTKEHIKARSRQFYVDAVSFIISAAKAGLVSTYVNGVLWETIWHVVFGQSPSFRGLHLPECELYFCD